MSHWAELDDNNIVVGVIVAPNDEDEGWSVVSNLPGRWVRTSYNNNIRKRYAGIGYFYDEDRDAFIPPRPYENWVLNEEKLDWVPPIPYPADELPHEWNQETMTWVPIKKPFPSWICENRVWRAPSYEIVGTPSDPDSMKQPRWSEARKVWIYE